MCLPCLIVNAEVLRQVCDQAGGRRRPMNALNVEVLWPGFGHRAVPEQHVGASGLAIEGSLRAEHVWVAE